MARRIREGPPSVEVPQGRVPPGRRLTWVGPVAFVVLLALISVVYSLVHHGSATKGHQGYANSPPPSAAPLPAVPGMPATVAGFAALTPDHQRTLMQQQLTRFDAGLDSAYRTLDPSILSQVTTGAELQTQTQLVESLKAKGTPGGGTHTHTITGIGVAPALGSVSVRTQGTDTTWWLNPQTLQPMGTPNTIATSGTYVFVPEDGTWKVEAVTG
jgi:hypothetical protein